MPRDRREYWRAYYSAHKDVIGARQKRRYQLKRVFILAELQRRRDAAKAGDSQMGLGHA